MLLSPSKVRKAAFDLSNSISSSVCWASWSKVPGGLKLILRTRPWKAVWRARFGDSDFCFVVKTGRW